MPVVAGLAFLSPLGGLVALAVALPLAGLALAERRSASVRRVLGLAPPGRRRRAELTACFAALALLLGLAAAQPVLARPQAAAARADAEALFVLDVSKSMQAAPERGGATRLERAKALAVRLRAALGDVPAGVASMTDRVLPHLFPSPNEAVFDATIASSLGTEDPPPSIVNGGPGARATTLGALSVVAAHGYFSPAARHRLLIVLSDDESLPFESASVGSVFRRPPGVKTIFVRFWSARERVYLANGQVDPLYRPDPTSARIVESLAEATRGRAFHESQFGAIARTARADLGHGTVRSELVGRARRPIGGWFALAAVVPLALVVRRRNL